MRIVFLVENAAQLWGGTKVVLEDANRLAARGHEVAVVSNSAAPTWMEIHCEFRTVQSFSPEHIPAADLVVGTFWTTIPHAVRATSSQGSGAAVHFCQGYEGGRPWRWRGPWPGSRRGPCRR